MIQTSVVIPAYNAARWIVEALESVYSQADDTVETIVVDDGSADNTAQIVSTRFPNVILLSQPNQGVSAARTRGMALAQGRYVKYLDADDMLAPGVIKRQVLLADETNADVVYGNWHRIRNDDGRGWCVAETVIRRIEDVNVDIELALFGKMWCTTGAYLWRSSFLRTKHPGWSVTLPVIQDARFAFDAAISGASFVYDNQPAAIYRCHSSESLSKRNMIAFNRDLLTNATEVYDLWRQHGTLTQERKRELLDMCETQGLLAYSADLKLAQQFFALARSIDERWLPNQSRLRRWIARTAGVDNLARLRSWSVSFRNMLRRHRVPLR